MTTSLLPCKTCDNNNPAQATFCMTCGEPLDTITANPKNLTGLLEYDQLLKQRYRILTQIGRGGFGAVYQAEDTKLGDRRVAIKEMSQSGLSSKELADAVTAFQHEARLLAGLQHPNLPRIYDHFSDSGRWYLVMDFLAGHTLEDTIQQQHDHRLALRETLDIGLQICSVLDYLHTQHPPIIFRDLKPANIMRVPPQHLYLIDFGIARHFKPGQTKDTIPFGSPGYAAPEQYGKAQTTQQSDIYSLGVLLHQLLSGEDPSEKPFLLSPLRLYGPAIPELEALITRMTALNAAQRPASISEVQTTLQALAARSTEKPFSFQPAQPPYERPRISEQQRERERFDTQNFGTDDYGVEREQIQEQMQEQVPLPPVNPARRRLLIAGLITGATLVAGASGLLAFLPKSHSKPILPVPTAQLATPKPVINLGPDSMFGYDAQHSGFNASETLLNPSNVSRLQVAWLSQPLSLNYFSSPTVSGDMLYVGANDGSLFALNALSGQIRWYSKPHSRLSSAANSSTAAVANGVVYITLQDGKLYAFDAISGSIRWSSPANYALDCSPIVVNGVVYASSNASVYAFDASSGHLHWTSPPIGPHSNSPVAIANNLVYVAIAGIGAGIGHIYALDIVTGQPHWVSDPIKNGIDDNSSPTIAHGLVYIGSGNGGVAAFDATTGHTRWITTPHSRGSTGSSPAVDHKRVYLSSDQVYAFDALTGQSLWISETIGASNTDSTTVANGVVYVCSISTNSVYALDAATGKTLWISPPTKGQLFTTPTVSNGTLYLASQDNDGTIYAFRIPT